MTTVQQLATEYAAMFEQRTPAGGDEDAPKRWYMKDGAPQELTAIVYAGHSDMMPDDAKYEYVLHAFDIISELDEEADEDAFNERCGEIEPDCYTVELTRWLASHIQRQFYVDEVLEGCDVDSCSMLLMMAQVREREEVARLVWDALVALAGETE